MIKRRSGPGGSSPRVSVIVPALDEAPNLPYVLGDLPPGIYEVLLVDGGSVDGTVEVARRLLPGVRLVSQTRRGKGNALACGFAAARGDIIVTLDADGSADPREITRFVAALTAGADLAKGTRFAAGGGSDDLTPVRRVGNRVLSGLVNSVFGTRFTDLCYGYNAFWADCLETLELDAPSGTPEGSEGSARRRGDGFEFETLLSIRVAVAGLRVTEVASFERKRMYGVSKLNAVSDGLRIVATILQERRGVHRSRAGAGSGLSLVWEKRARPAQGRGWPCQTSERSPG